MLLFFLPVLMGAECDPDQPIRSSFDNEFVPLRRDNVVASGFIYDEHDELPGYDYAAAVYLPSDVYQVETEVASVWIKLKLETNPHTGEELVVISFHEWDHTRPN